MDGMTATPRPRVVTLACVFVGFSAFLLLLDLIQALSNWGTIEMQDGLRPSLSVLRDNGFDVTMGELLSALHWFGLACVLLLVATLVFAVYAARGDQVSRIGTSVLAVVLGLLIVPFGWLGLVQALFLLAAASMLWSADARQWYVTHQAPAGAAAAAGPDAAKPSVNEWTPPAQSVPTVEVPAMRVRTTRRPRAVLAAGLVTVIGSSLVGGLSAIYLLIYGFARDEYVHVVKDGPFSDIYSPGELDTALRAAFWACLLLVPLAAAGLAAGLSLLARQRIGRAATLALSWVTAAVGVVLVPFGLLGTGAAVAVIILLNRDESRAWAAGAL
jgi:hypothetical protein